MERVAAILKPAVQRGLQYARGHPLAYMYGPMLNSVAEDSTREVPASANPSEDASNQRPLASRVLAALQARAPPGVTPTSVKVNRSVEVEVELELAQPEEESLTPTSEDPPATPANSQTPPPGHGHATRSAVRAEQREELSQQLVLRLGGRFSRQLGIDVEQGSKEVERWLLASVLFTHRVPVETIVQAHRALTAAGVDTVDSASQRELPELVELLESGGYTQHKHQVARRLHRLASALVQEGGLTALEEIDDPRELKQALERLSGLGGTAVRQFLREMEGVWPGAQGEVDDRVTHAAEHLGLLDHPKTGKRKRKDEDPVHPLKQLAEAAGVHIKDLEAALVRLSIAHSRFYRLCPGGMECEGIPKEGANGTGTIEDAFASVMNRNSSAQAKIVSPSLNSGMFSDVESPPAKAARLTKNIESELLPTDLGKVE